MTRPVKLALGVATIAPLLWMVAWFGYLIYGFVGDGPWKGFGAMFAGMAVVTLLAVALSVFYGLHAWRNPRLQGDERVIWTIFVVLLNAFAQPIYWYLHVWRAAPSTPPAQAGQWQQVGPQ